MKTSLKAKNPHVNEDFWFFFEASEEILLFVRIFDAGDVLPH